MLICRGVVANEGCPFFCPAALGMGQPSGLPFLGAPLPWDHLADTDTACSNFVHRLNPDGGDESFV